MPRSKFGNIYKRKTLEKAYLIVKESDGLICEEIVQKLDYANITIDRLSQWLRSDDRYVRVFVYPDGSFSRGRVFKYTVRDD